jgi:hypothetical protein
MQLFACSECSCVHGLALACFCHFTEGANGAWMLIPGRSYQGKTNEGLCAAHLIEDVIVDVSKALMSEWYW